MDLKGRAKKLKADIPAVFIALKDRDTPVIARVFAGITVGYALSPVDLIPADVWKRSREKAVNLWKDGKPKKWYYAIPVVIFWALVILLIIRAIWL